MDDRSLNAPHLVIELDDGLRVIGLNRRAAELLGVPEEDAIGRGIADVAPLRGERAWTEMLAAEGGPPEVRALDRGGEQRHLEVWWQRTTAGDGRPGAATVYGHDVSARVVADQRRSLEAEMLHAIINNLDIVTWAIDGEGNFLYQDGKALRRLGQGPHALVGQNLFKLFGANLTSDNARRALDGEARLGVRGEAYGRLWTNFYIPVSGSGQAKVVSATIDITDTVQRETELLAKIELIEKQRELIRELSTPILEIWDGVLALPIVGLVDSTRTREIMENLLQTVVRLRARFAILDLTGVEVVDTGTASHLISMIQALRLLGAEGILTGIHPTIAQTVVSLGIDLSRVIVHARLRDALHYCISQLGGK